MKEEDVKLNFKNQVGLEWQKEGEKKFKQKSRHE